MGVAADDAPQGFVFVGLLGPALAALGVDLLDLGLQRYADDLVV